MAHGTKWTLFVGLLALSCRGAKSPDTSAETCKPSSGPTRPFVFRIENDLTAPAVLSLKLDGCAIGGASALPVKGVQTTDLAVKRDGRQRLRVSVTVGDVKLEWSRLITEFEDDLALVASDRTGIATIAPAPDTVPLACESRDTALVPIRIRFADTMSTAFLLRRLDLRLDGKPLVDDPRKLAEAASTGRPVTYSLSTTRRCHTLVVSLEYQGHGEGSLAWMQGYKFDVHGSRTFDAVDGTGLDVIAYEHDNVPIEARPALRYHEERPKSP